MPDACSTRPLLDKLGVKPGCSVALIGEAPPAFVALLAERTAHVSHGAPTSPCDLLFYFVTAAAELERLAELEPHLARNGGIWVVRAKGKGALVGELDVIEAGKRALLVDNKVVSFSDTHSALRLVIPLSRR